MTSHRILASGALFAALLVAAVCQLVLHITTLNILGGSVAAQFWQPLLQTFAYGLPLGGAAVLATEFLRLRQVKAQIAIGTALTFFAAHLATRGEPLTSYVFAGGVLTGLGLLATGVAASATYWAIAGRRAGWRGDDVERDDERATQAFRRVSEQHAKIEHCQHCLLTWAGASAAVFGLFAWLMIDVSGLRAGLLAMAQSEGQTALTNSGYAWADFKISGSRGAIAGKAPDELEKRTAYDAAREALSAVTGFPGVLSRIDDQAFAEMPMAAFNQQLADAKAREQQANQAIEEARRLAEAARTAEADAERKAEAQAIAADAERKKVLEQQQAEQAELERRAAEALLSANAVADPAGEPQEQVVAALSTEAPSADQVGASAPDPAGETSNCTVQDVALVESSHILFEPQSFEIGPAFQRDLDRMAASVRSCAQRPILVTGHSDANADRLFNPALGLQRAEAVREGLVARGVSATRIASAAPPNGLFGDTDGSAEARDVFRRTDFKFLEVAELSRDATQGPDERAQNCESDLADIMSQSIIHFPIASSRVSEESSPLISKLAGAIQNCGSVIVTVEGHTDKVGTEERNQQLSIARANAVREALVAVGADSTRLASRGFASSRPYAVEETAEAYALNRRIEFKVSGKFTSTNAGGP